MATSGYAGSLGFVGTSGATSTTKTPDNTTKFIDGPPEAGPPRVGPPEAGPPIAASLATALAENGIDNSANKLSVTIVWHSDCDLVFHAYNGIEETYHGGNY